MALGKTSLISNLWLDLKYRFYQKYYRYFQPNLSEILSNADPKASLDNRVLWLEGLLNWVRTPIAPTGTRTGPAFIQSARVRFLLQVLERNPDWKLRSGQVIMSVLLETDPTNLFAVTGLPRQAGFFSELFDRLVGRVLPSNRNALDASELLTHFFSDEMDAHWINTLDPITLSELFRFIFINEDARVDLRKHYRESLRSALVILSSQAEALAMSPELRMRSGVTRAHHSAFWHYRFATNRLAETLFDFSFSPEDQQKAFEDFQKQTQLCRKEMQLITTHLEECGVSVQIVFRLELIERCIQRAELISQILADLRDDKATQTWQSFISGLILENIQSRQMRPLLSNSLHLLSRTIVERSSQSGEHYITRNLEEYKKMALSAAGGGALTTFTTLFKFLITKANPAMFVEGTLSTINYAGSFLLMHGLHFTLATKQPSMTAPALASRLKSIKQRVQIQSFIDEVANLTRSQFIAAVGNVGVVIPCALAFHLFYWVFTQDSMLDPYYSIATIESLNPLTSLTIFYAFLTGCILFISSLAAGSFDNWFTYRQLGPAIAKSQTLQLILGVGKASSFASWLTRNASAIGGNVSLGFLLAFFPIFGEFFGLPLDVRHVTLSAGALTFAATSIPLEIFPWWTFAGACLGILLIGMLNFGISFILAMIVAINAQNIRKSWLSEILRCTGEEMRLRPLYFLIPKNNSK